MSFINSNDAAMGVSTYERAALDHYPTVEWVSEAIIPTLLSIVPSNTKVWEPACGTGAMSRVLARHFDEVVSTDITDYGYGQAGVDFLWTHEPLADVIVTNPPYGDDAERFIRHALRLVSPENGVVAMLMRNEYDCSKRRVDLFRDAPFWRKVVLTTRPRWIEGSDGSPRHNYSWYVWSYSAGTPATITYHVR